MRYVLDITILRIKKSVTTFYIPIFIGLNNDEYTKLGNKNYPMSVTNFQQILSSSGAQSVQRLVPHKVTL